MNEQHFAALLGFAFAAAWIGFGFGEAILCLAAAGVFYAVARFMAGDLDVGNVRERIEGARSGFTHGAHRQGGAPRPVDTPPPGETTRSGESTRPGTRVH